MPDDDRDRIRDLISKGADLAGAAVGGALGFFAAGPTGAAVGATAGTLFKQVLEIGGEICHRALSPRETMRVGAAYAFAGAAIKEKLDRGEDPRHDGFFKFDATGRSSAEELLEGVLLHCKNEHEEKKLRFISNIFANAAFSNVSPADANTVLSIAERLSFRQMCLMAAIGRSAEFQVRLEFGFSRLGVVVLGQKGVGPLVTEIVQLQQVYGTVTDTGSTGETILTTVGETCFELMSLNEVSPVDIKAALSQLETAFKKE